MGPKDEKKFDLSYLVYGLKPYTCVTKTFEFNGFRRVDSESENELWNVFWGFAD